MTKWTIPDAPSPEAIVKAALEWAAVELEAWGDIYGENAARSVRTIASDPAAVAQIIMAAGEDRG
jgi:hypothetical protein